MATRHLFHYTDDDGYKAISAGRAWIFKAYQPPGPRPEGAYFTTLDPNTRNLAKRLRLPKMKLEFLFCFTDRFDLIPLPGSRGAFILYSPKDYVEEDRQILHGSRAAALEHLS